MFFKFQRCSNNAAFLVSVYSWISFYGIIQTVKTNIKTNRSNEGIHEWYLLSSGFDKVVGKYGSKEEETCSTSKR